MGAGARHARDGAHGRRLDPRQRDRRRGLRGGGPARRRRPTSTAVPTALPLDHVERILDETTARVEIVHNGNVKAAGEVAALVARRGELHRLVIGTDSPAGSGAQPLGMLRAISWVASLGGVDPALAVAAATGNVAALHGSTPGWSPLGREADLLVMDAPLGSQADDALGALAIGDTPAVAIADHRRGAAVHEEPEHPAAGATGLVLGLAGRRRGAR